MSDEFVQYKTSKIQELTSTFNKNMDHLFKYYNFWRLRLKSNYRQRVLVKIVIYHINDLKSKLTTSISYYKNLVMPEIQPTNNNSALLVGINYIGTEHELSGCINDTNTIHSIVSHLYKNITLLTDDAVLKPDRNTILHYFTQMLLSSSAGDVLFFFYSGHGSYILDKNNDEKTGYDQMILPCDLNPIVDDEFNDIIKSTLKKDVTLICLFDSCYSGSMLDLKYQYMDSLENNDFTQQSNQSDTLGNVIMISGCSDIQTSVDALIDKNRQGAMTWAFKESFTPSITWRELIINMRTLLEKSHFSQIPQLSSGSFLNIDSRVIV